MTKRRSAVLAFAVALTCMALAGCPQGDKWQQAANASNQLIATVGDAQDAEIALYHGPFNPLTSEEHVRVQQVFKKIAQADKKLNDAISAGANAKDAQEAFDAALKITDDALTDGTLDVKDQAERATLYAAIRAARALLENIRQIGAG